MQCQNYTSEWINRKSKGIYNYKEIKEEKNKYKIKIKLVVKSKNRNL